VFVFLVAPLVALVGAFVTSLVLPWVLISGAIIALSGYQIWRIDHPGESARYELGWRVRGLLTAAAVGIAALALELAWIWVVVAAIAVGTIFLLVYALANRNPAPAPPIPGAPPKVPPDDSPSEG